MIAESTFKRNVLRLIMPLVAGTRLVECREDCGAHAVQKESATLQMTLTPGENSPYVLLLSRKQAFTDAEVHLVQAIMGKWAQAFNGPCPEEYADSIAVKCKLEAVAEFIDPTCSKLLLSVIDAMSDWSGQTYEGRRFAFSLGVDKDVSSGNGLLLQDILEEDFLKVMAAGHETLLVCSPKGRIVRHETLFEPDGDTLDELDGEKYSFYAPLTYVPLARWATGNRYAVTLNTDGEILIFKDGSLLFARRRGKWLFFTHTAYIDGMGEESVVKRKALYQTILDVSFNRTGGCLGLWHPRQATDDIPVTARDRLDLSGEASDKTRFLRTVINGRKFYELPRKLRQELLAMDGATVVLHSGDILAVGAILRIEGGSSGGGRLAAAKELAKKGLGVKIANDGKISYWVDLSRTEALEGKPVPPKYEIG